MTIRLLALQKNVDMCPSWMKANILFELENIDVSPEDVIHLRCGTTADYFFSLQVYNYRITENDLIFF